MSGGSVKNCTVNAQIEADSGYRNTARYAGGTIENCTVTTSSNGIRAYDDNSSRGVYTATAGGIAAYADIAKFASIKNCTFS